MTELSIIETWLKTAIMNESAVGCTAWANLVSLLGSSYIKSEGEFKVFKTMNDLYKVSHYTLLLDQSLTSLLLVSYLICAHPCAAIL